MVDGAAAGLVAAGLGATHLLLRIPSATTRDQYLELASLVAAASVPVLVSDRVDLALAAGAAGVNLPEAGLPVQAARRLLGPERVIGRSVHSVEGAARAAADGADLVVFGPVFPTPSHPEAPGLGLDALAAAVAASSAPVLAIGGIDAARGEGCLAAGAAGYAAIRLFREDGATGMIRLRVNGREVELPGPTTVGEYLDGLGVDRRAVAVELNERILERSELAAAPLGEGDVVEIVRMVGGGLARL